MTWKELADRISKMTEEQQETYVTVLLMNTDEVFGVIDFVDEEWDEVLADSDFGKESGIDQVIGVLDNGHPFIVVDF